MIDFFEKIALLTGASRGTGRAVARALAAQGEAVVAGARAMHAEAVAGEVRAAGGTADVARLDVTDASNVDAVIATNLTGAYPCTQAVLCPMIKQRSGLIINVSSVAGQMSHIGQADCAASKAGLIRLAKALAREVGSRNIMVNVVAPGLIDTDMTRAIGASTREAWAEQIPLGSLGTPEDVAWAVCCLASDQASYSTGQVLSRNVGTYT